MNDDALLFEDESWAKLPDFLGQLPEPVRIHVWGDEQASPNEREAARLIRAICDRFEQISFALLPRRISYDHYPVIGIMRSEEEVAVDYGVRIIGLPAGVQMTSLIAAIQTVAFRGMTSEAKTRILLKGLAEEVTLELITSAEDEAGTVMAHRIFNMAVASPYIRSFLIMIDDFPEAGIRYSVRRVPHLVINGRVHVEGVVDEEVILAHIARGVDQVSNADDPPQVD
jgi:alkyl hydroperoxide reductase subunit AhpF